MKQLQLSYRGYYYATVYPCVSVQCCVAESIWGGHFAVLPTVSLFEMKTSRKDWSGLYGIMVIALKMLYSAMNPLSNLKHIEKDAGRKERSQQISHVPNIRLWAGISTQGATDICIFTGIMDAEFYVKILNNCLLPFISDKFGSSNHRFTQDNDSKHVSHRAQSFFEEKNINWWRTPPESLDLNPIENLWHELKEYLRAKVKPRNLAELKAGIKAFWLTVSPQKCLKYIHRLDKVIPRVIELQGEATGY